MASVSDYLQLSRISNLPTCISNVLVGAAIGASSGASLSPMVITAIALSVSLMYVSGMALNDVCDSALDARERPTRPIPSGRIARAHAAIFATATMLAGIALLAFVGRYALLSGITLALTITAYDVLHQRFRPSVLLMGLCRGLIYIIAGAAITWPLPLPMLWPMVLALVLYVACVTLVAEAEAMPRVGRFAHAAGWACVAIPLLIFPMYSSTYWPCATLAAVAMTIAGVHANLLLRATPPRTMRAVMAMLANICLIDAFFLVLLGRLYFAAAAIGCYIITRLLHRRIMGT